MKLKGIISITVCFILAVTMFVGCGQDTAKENKISEAVTSSAATSEATPEAPVKLSKEPVKLVYVRPNWSELKIDSEPVMRVRKAIFEKTNIDIELVNTGADTNKINLMIAAGEHFDMCYDSVYGAGLELPRLVKEGVLRPLDDLLQANAPDALTKIDPRTWKYVQYEGKTYGFPGEQPKNQFALLYRKDWLDADGLKVPATIEEWEIVAKDFKEKHNDPGYTVLGAYYLEQGFLGSFVPTGAGNFLDTDGKIKIYYMHKNFKDYLAKMQDWYTKGYINKEFATMKTDQAMNLLNTAKVGLSLSWADPAGLAEQAKNVDPKAEYFWGPPLDNGTEKGVYTYTSQIYDWVGVTNDCKNPDIALKYLNWSCTTTEGFELSMMGEEGTDWILNKRDGDRVYVNINDKLSKENVYPGGFLNGMLNGPWVDTLYINYFLGTSSNTYASDTNNYEIAVNPDSGLLFDTNTMSRSKDNAPEIAVKMEEARYQIIMGQKPVEYWDEMLKKYEEGINNIVEDMTDQYNAWKQ